MSLSRRELFGSLATLPFKALESATSHARLRGNPYVELAHWLHQILGQPDSDCHRLLRAAGADLDLIIREIAAAVAVLPSGAGSSIDFSHTLEQATDRAWVMASLRFGGSRTRSGALLWALSTHPELRRATQAASPTLARVALEQLAPRWDELLAGSPEADGSGGLTRVTPQGEDASDARESSGSALERYCTDLTDRARDGMLDPVLGRGQEIRTMIDILMRRRQNNPLLTGDAGVGKTAVVEGLALAIASEDVPLPLRGVRLGMQAGEVADPYVERLLEGFSFMSARMRIKLDAEFPRFTQRLLEVLYPNYVSPTPSMGVVRLVPDLDQGDLTQGHVVPRGTAMYSRVPPGEQTACEFRTGQATTLWPIEITHATLGGVPPDIPGLERCLPGGAVPRGSLRLRLRLLAEGGFSDLRGLDRLPVHLAGDPTVASRLFELLHAGAFASFIAAPGELSSTQRPPHVVTRDALVHDSFEPSQSLLPLEWTSVHGHNLLHEYFACPERFWCFALQGLGAGLRAIAGREVEIVVLLDRPPGELAGLVDAQRFALNCVPVINLFQQRVDRVNIDPGQPEFHVVPDRSRPIDFEVYSVVSMQTQPEVGQPAQQFRPLYDTLNHDEGDHGRYFSLRREARLQSQSSRRYGARSEYVGSEVFASLVDQREAPYSANLRHLSVQAWLTNRDLPALIPCNGVDDLMLGGPESGITAGFLWRPTSPRAPFAAGESAWRLIRQLGFNHLPLTELDHREGGQALRDMLRLFAPDGTPAVQAEIGALIGSRLTPVTRRLPGSGPLVYGRGVQCTLTVDEKGFSGSSPYLFGLILSYYLTRHVAINTFVETKLVSIQRGDVGLWSVRPGTRGVA